MPPPPPRGAQRRKRRVQRQPISRDTAVIVPHATAGSVVIAGAIVVAPAVPPDVLMLECGDRRRVKVGYHGAQRDGRGGHATRAVCA